MSAGRTDYGSLETISVLLSADMTIGCGNACGARNARADMLQSRAIHEIDHGIGVRYSEARVFWGV